ncbi:type II toxin-antitoxin system RelE/ParE family toxin [Aerococcaceae bacterium NML191292]|nr:type II toxin-antitoxin system RelE/ParE family toxin [Aerococcaceae bacterium NML191292]
MMSIRIEKKARKFLEKLPQNIKTRILQAIYRYPYSDVKKLKGTPYYRMRVGDYRIIYDENGNVISIIEIGHRKNIYNNY